MAALASYGSVLGELAPLIALTFARLIVMGVAMWLAERPMKPHSHESVVDTLRDGVYLGGRHDDDGRLWRQDAEDHGRAGDCGRMDAGQRRAHFYPVDLDRIKNDRGTRGGRTSRDRRGPGR